MLKMSLLAFENNKFHLNHLSFTNIRNRTCHTHRINRHHCNRPHRILSSQYPHHYLIPIIQRNFSKPDFEKCLG
jgi:hypothetical protein